MDTEYTVHLHIHITTIPFSKSAFASGSSNLWFKSTRKEGSVQNIIHRCHVADPDPGSGAFLSPGPGIRNRFSLDPGYQTHIFQSFAIIFRIKSSIILCELAYIFFFTFFKKKNNLNFVLFKATKKEGQKLGGIKIWIRNPA
jgi:hypothetical protein